MQRLLMVGLPTKRLPVKRQPMDQALSALAQARRIRGRSRQALTPHPQDLDRRAGPPAIRRRCMAQSTQDS
jgi:hypothetical protein